MRKHGGTLAAVLDYAADARARREQLAGAEVALAAATAQLGEAHAALEGHVTALRDARERHAPRLELAVREQLAALAMADATFEVSLSPREAGPSGGDAVEFMIAPNPGVPAGPLREIGSGGELSRVMLALATVPARPSPARSGARAGAPLLLRRRRRSCSTRSMQVSAAIPRARSASACASWAATGRCCASPTCPRSPRSAIVTSRWSRTPPPTPTRATVVQLAEGEVVSELVRMLGADAADSAARAHARDLRKAA